ncbi:CRISPR-associated protein Cas4 [Pelosinus sp. sgz500959]|uniref:CRISPR-associated protein Cas4 n=1 Tax=Pelosinus sp. sgz500959 TaxID=3242472 RepID=UPI0036702798
MEKAINGTMIYYYIVCKRKLWYFFHNIQMEQENENVKIGKILDEESYRREEKHITIDNVISIDYIKQKGILHEVKKSRKIEEAGIWQVKYYLYYLKQKGVTDIKAKIDYPLLRQTLDVELTLEDEVEIEHMLDGIKKVVSEKIPNIPDKIKICKSCAYYDLCYI